MPPSPADEAVESLWRILAVGGHIPRRAVVLPDGSLGDRRAHPDVPESELLSRVCEVVRAARGQPCEPRRTAELVDRALAGNCPHAWAAVRDDMVTGDLDLDVAAAVLRHSSNAAAVVACLAGARDGDHLLHVACLLAQTMDRLDDETRADMGRALACQLRPVMDQLHAKGHLMTRDLRDAVISGFGKLLARTHVPDARLAEYAVHVVAEGQDDLVRLFLHVPPTFLEHRPQLLAAVVDRALAVPRDAKYPLVALLARLVRQYPSAVAGHEAVLADVACELLPDDDAFEARESLAAASLVCDGGVEGARVCAALARALRACACRMVATQKSV